MRQFGRLAAACAATAVIFCCSTPSEAAGAIAVGPCGSDGYSYDHPTREQAEERALQECGPKCEVVVTFHNACGAFATDVAKSCGPQGWAWNAERGAAEDMAIRECINQGGGQCQVKRWVCDGG